MKQLPPFLPTLLAVVLLGLLGPIRPAFAASPAGGAEAYAAGDLQAARTAFETALTAGETPALRHNLALACFRLGDTGEAAWNLERALLLDPLNPRYRAKLAALREQAGFFEGSVEWFAIAAQTLPLNAWLFLAATAFWLLAALLVLPRISRQRLRFWQKGLAWICGLALVLALPAIWKQERLRDRGIVLDSTTLRAAPASGAPAAAPTRPAERARILDTRDSFFRVETESGATGWIASQDFRPLLDTPRPPTEAVKPRARQ